MDKLPAQRTHTPLPGERAVARATLARSPPLLCLARKRWPRVTLTLPTGRTATSHASHATLRSPLSSVPHDSHALSRALCSYCRPNDLRGRSRHRCSACCSTGAPGGSGLCRSVDANCDTYAGRGCRNYFCMRLRALPRAPSAVPVYASPHYEPPPPNWSRLFVRGIGWVHIENRPNRPRSHTRRMYVASLLRTGAHYTRLGLTEPGLAASRLRP